MKKVFFLLFCIPFLKINLFSLNVETEASLVLGQKNFYTRSVNSVDNYGLYTPYDIAIDANSGRIYVADMMNNRVLWWDNIESLINGKQADGVVGQPDLYSDLENRGNNTPSANSLYHPCGVFVDNSGNLWVADTDNNRVLKFKSPITTGMSAELVLGQADFNSGLANRGSSIAANTLNIPYSVFVDSLNNIWVCDGSNHRVLKYSNPTTNGQDADFVLGQADFTSGSANRGGPPAENTLNRPSGIFVDIYGNVWIADRNNHRVVKYPKGSTTADFVFGQVDLSTNSANRGGSVSQNSLKNPRDVCVGYALSNSTCVWVTDAGNNRLVMYSTSISTHNAQIVLGQPDFTSGSINQGMGILYCSSVTLYSPFGLFIDKNGFLWIADSGNNRVLKYGSNLHYNLSNGKAATLVLGQRDFVHNEKNVVDATGVSAPESVCVDKTSKRVYVSDCVNHRVLWWENIEDLINGNQADGVVGQPDFYSNRPNQGKGVSADTLYYPGDIDVDSEGNLWVVDSGNNRVLKFNKPTSNGEKAVLVLGQVDFSTNSVNQGSGVSASSLYHPYGICVDKYDNVWVTDGGNHRVLKFIKPTTNGQNASLVLGQGSFNIASPNGGGTSPQANTLCEPQDVFVDDNNNVWVVDCYNNRVLRFSNPKFDGQDADLVLGQEDFNSNSSNRGGSVASNTLSYPYSVFVDSSNNVWVSDSNNQRVLLYSDPKTNGVNAIFVLGQGDFNSSSPNRGNLCPSANTLYSPGYIYINSSGIWIADGGNNRVVKYSFCKPSPQIVYKNDLSEVKRYPNPYNPLKHTGGLVIDGLTQQAKIKIYTLTGELVKEVEYNTANGIATWDGKNTKGSVVSSGVYIIYIEGSNGEKKKLKFVVEK